MTIDVISHANNALSLRLKGVRVLGKRLKKEQKKRKAKHIEEKERKRIKRKGRGKKYKPKRFV